MNKVKNKITNNNSINVNILNLTDNYLTASLIGYIHFFYTNSDSKRKYCYASDDVLSNYFKVSPSSISKLIGKLKRDGLISSSNTMWLGKKERRTVLTERCLAIYDLKKEESEDVLKEILNKDNKKTTETMENLDESIFSDKPVEQKPLKGKSLIIPGDSIIEKDEVEFNKLRASYFQPKVYGKKKELKAYKELTEEERSLAFNNLKQYLELTDELYIMSLQNYLQNKKFSNENIEFLKKCKASKKNKTQQFEESKIVEPGKFKNLIDQENTTQSTNKFKDLK